MVAIQVCTVRGTRLPGLKTGLNAILTDKPGGLGAAIPHVLSGTEWNIHNQFESLPDSGPEMAVRSC